MKFVVLGSALAALSALTAVPAAATHIDRHFDRSFEVAPGARVHIAHDDGDVDVIPWDQNTVQIVVDYRADVKNLVGARPDFDVEFRQDGGDIWVRGHEKGRRGIVIEVRQYEYRYKVRAPAWVELDLDGDDGDVRISGWRGNVDCRLDDGDVQLRDVHCELTRIRLEDGDLVARDLVTDLEFRGDDGDATIRNSMIGDAVLEIGDGDMLLQNCQGNFHLSVDDGQIGADRILAQTMDVRCGDGDIELDLLRTDNLDLTVVTDDGSVDVAVEEGTSAAFELETEDGRITLDVPDAEEVRKDRRRVSGVLQGGHGSVRIRSNDGSVTFRSI